MLLPSRSEATAAHRAALVIVINNVWLIWLIKQSGNPLPVGNTTSSRITKITSELSALVTPLSDKKWDSRSRSKNTFMRRSFASRVSVTLKVLVCSLATLNRRFSGQLCVADRRYWTLQITATPSAWFVPGQWPNAFMFDVFFTSCTSWVMRNAILICSILFLVWSEKTAVGFRAKSTCNKKSSVPHICYLLSTLAVLITISGSETLLEILFILSML